MIEKNKKSITYEELANIGVLEIVEKELKREELISKFKILNKKSNKDIKKDWLLSNKINSEKELKSWLLSNNIGSKDLERIILREWLWIEWCKNKFKDELSSYYLKRKDDLDAVIYSLIRIKEENFANEIYLRIKDDNIKFSDLAGEFSEGVEKQSGGIIGPVTINNSHPKISHLLKISEENQLWPPIYIDNWWIILRLEKKMITTLDKKIRLKLSLELGEKYIS